MRQPRALTLAGGGFKAQAIYSALTAGLLARQAALDSTESPGDAVGSLIELYEGVDIISSNSGGSWFAAGLIYSSMFQSVLFEMSRNVATAGEIYYDKVLRKFLVA